MRYLVGFVFVLALVALPLSVGAQDVEAGTASEPTAAPPAPSSQPAPDEPALQLQLDEAGAEVVEMQRRVRNAKIGVGISGLSVLVGGVLTAAAFSEGILPDDPEAYADQQGLEIAAATLLVGGLVSLLTTAIMVGVRKRTLQSHERKLRELQRDLPLGASASTVVAPGTVNALEVQPQARRAQWDLARSRLVF